MKEKLTAILQTAKNDIAQVTDLKQLEELRLTYLAKKSELSQTLRLLGSLPENERKIMGKLANEVKIEIEALLYEKKTILQASVWKLQLDTEAVDVTLPGLSVGAGSLHPLTHILREITAIFMELGYAVAEGPEMETDYYNFTALNIPEDHPARAMHDSFYLSNGKVLRTHTSPVQVHVMENQAPPIKIIAPGKVFRKDADISHSPVFHQVEGLYIDENITFANLKGTLEYFLRRMFGENKKVRFRPSYFPFTEPSAEVDIECIICNGKGCRMCKQTGWIEILGSGMVHPNVLKMSKIDPAVYSGFAFGMGIERIAILKYGIDDIHLFYSNHRWFNRQF